MKILAVIPARAGSKGVPNKNIRLLHGKPLIYYAIKNAINSVYITDVVVSTDSHEVKIIADQMGVSVKWRDAYLCEDHITLDSVIYDAIKGYDVDYVITMQPTSPTLKYKTLDLAIEYIMNNKIDTLISTINQPHFSWKVDEEKNKKYPNYEKRLNRQYLPPSYMETGSFLITKTDAITEYTRIGKNVDVFEISEEESIDIDNFLDLKNCEHIIGNKTVAFYVNGNNKIGLGHIYRCLEMADEFYIKPDIYYDINQTDINLFGNTTHTLIGINNLNELYKCIHKNKYDIFINDVLNTSIKHMDNIINSNNNIKIINFEDAGEGVLKADLVINALYDNPTVPHMKTGYRYYICGKIFLFYKPIKINETIKRVLISFGGSDPRNYTDRLLEIIKTDEYEDIEFIVVLGKAKKNVQELLKYNKFKNINIIYDIKNMAEIMSKCDIAITSRGRTGYELSILGIPSIAIAQNSREEEHGFMSEENGFRYIGLEPNNEVIKKTLDIYINLTKEERRCLQQKLLSFDLTNGRRRIMGLIDSL